MAWHDGAIKGSDGLLDVIESYRDQIRDAARIIRHCDCDQGFIVGTRMMGEREYPCVRMCHCLKAYKSVHREMMQKIREWERKSNLEYRNPLTAEMTYFAHPKGNAPTRAQMERGRRACAGMDFDLPEEAVYETA